MSMFKRPYSSRDINGGFDWKPYQPKINWVAFGRILTPLILVPVAVAIIIIAITFL
jgi:hypothetical protein